MAKTRIAVVEEDDESDTDSDKSTATSLPPPSTPALASAAVPSLGEVAGVGSSLAAPVATASLLSPPQAVPPPAVAAPPLPPTAEAAPSTSAAAAPALPTFLPPQTLDERMLELKNGGNELFKQQDFRGAVQMYRCWALGPQGRCWDVGIWDDSAADLCVVIPDTI